jgi:hypothetical protein
MMSFKTYENNKTQDMNTSTSNQDGSGFTLRRLVALLSLSALSVMAFAADGDPSGRVGRMAFVQGQVTLQASQQEAAIQAGINWPVTSQNRIVNARDARSELRIGSTIIQLNSDSELEVSELTDERFIMRLNYGSMTVQLSDPAIQGELQVRTPEGLLRMNEAGRVRIDSDVVPDTTAISVFGGAAWFDGAGSSMKVTAGKRIDITADNFRSSQVRADAFDEWANVRDKPGMASTRSAALRYVSPETTGAEELDQYGDWRETEEYGPVWSPRMVGADWAPYRDGRWTWVAPWGWTWIDNAPWGYAPSHYGRWVMIGSRWCWAPGQVVARPVWAPALVGWTGGAQWNVSLGFGAGPAIGWFPLAPREAYVPYYRVSSRYVENLNYSHYWNHGGRGDKVVVYNAPPKYRYATDAITVLPQQNFNGRGAIAVTNSSRIVVPRERLRIAPVEVDRRFIEGQQRHVEVVREVVREPGRSDGQPRRVDAVRIDNQPRRVDAVRPDIAPRQAEPAHLDMSRAEPYRGDVRRSEFSGPQLTRPAVTPQVVTPPPATEAAQLNVRRDEGRGRGENNGRNEGRNESRNDARPDARPVTPVQAQPQPQPAPPRNQDGERNAHRDHKKDERENGIKP